MLLRLRQAATHPFLLEGMMGKHFSLGVIRTLRKDLAVLKGRKTIYEQIGSWNQRHEISNERIQKVLEEAERRLRKNAKFTSYGTFDDDGTDSRSKVEAQTSSSVTASPNTKSTGAQAIIINDDSDEVDSQDEAEEDSDGMAPSKSFGARSAKDTNRVGDIRVEEETMPHSERFEDIYLDPFGQSDFGLYFDMDKHLEYLERFKELQIARCAICDSSPRIPVKGQVNQRHMRLGGSVSVANERSQCGCIFCTKCLMTYATTKV